MNRPFRLLSRLLRLRDIDCRDDRGVALATVLLIMLAVTAIGATVAVVGVNNLNNASRDRAAQSSLGAGDAGVAQAIEYLRNNGVGALSCPETNLSACASNPAGWSNPTNPQLVPLDNAGLGCNVGHSNCARVWIGTVLAYAPPAVKSGIYNIHSEGIYGPGPSARQLVARVRVTPDKFPIGVFGQTVSGNGGTAVYTESLFTTGCVSPRQSGNGNSNGTRFSGIDSYWGQPAAGHTTSHISTANNCGSGGYIHSSSPSSTTAAAGACPSDSLLSYDQDGDGGLVSSSVGSACYRNYTRPDGSSYPDGVCPSGVTPSRPDGLCDTTAFTTADLERYGYRPRGLSDDQYKSLKERSQAQGLYNVTISSIANQINSVVNVQQVNNPIVYWDCSETNSACSSGGTLSLKYSDFPPGLFDKAPTDTTSSCQKPFRIVTIVVEHANLDFQGGNNTWFDAAVFVPDGSFSGAGGYSILGTLFSNNLELGGGQNWQLDKCWVTNMPGPLTTIRQIGFREDDSKDVP